MTGVLGVDGGQSAIRLRHSSDERVIEVPGVSHQEGDTIELVAAAVAGGWRDGGFDPVDLVVLGLTTAPIDPGPVRPPVPAGGRLHWCPGSLAHG